MTFLCVPPSPKNRCSSLSVYRVGVQSSEESAAILLQILRTMDYRTKIKPSNVVNTVPHPAPKTRLGHFVSDPPKRSNHYISERSPGVLKKRYLLVLGSGYLVDLY